VKQLPLQTDSLEMNFGRYEFLPTDSNRILFSVDSINATHIDSFSIGHEGMSMPFSLWVNSVFFLLFVASFVIFSLVFRKEGLALIGNFRQILSIRKHQTAGFKRQVTTTEVWGEFFLVLQAILVIAILIYTFLWGQGIVIHSVKGNALFFSALLLIPAVMILLKLLMYRTIGAFFMQYDMRRWTNRYYRLVGLMGILLFLPVLLYVFIPELRNSVQMLFLFIFIMSRLVIVLGLLDIFVKNKVGGFYFFIYLCGTEIAPYILFYKVVILFITLAGNIFI
jgi:hypothetical protein